MITFFWNGGGLILKFFLKNIFLLIFTIIIHSSPTTRYIFSNRMIILLQCANKEHIINWGDTKISVLRFPDSRTKFVGFKVLIEICSHGPFLLFLVLVSYIFESARWTSVQWVCFRLPFNFWFFCFKLGYFFSVLNGHQQFPYTK